MHDAHAYYCMMHNANTDCYMLHAFLHTSQIHFYETTKIAIGIKCP
jgi:hypothetical protein